MSAAPAGAPAPRLELIAHGASAIDAERGVARLDPADLQRLGLRAGDIIRIEGPGGAAAHARALPTHARHRGLGLVLLDGLQRENARATIGDVVVVSPARPAPALGLTIAFATLRDAHGLSPEAVRTRLLDWPVAAGERVRLRPAGGLASVARTTPEGPVLIGPATQVQLETPRAAPRPAAAAREGKGYAGLGGLAPQLARVREMIELPLQRPELFLHLGVEPPKGVLFVGPPGTPRPISARRWRRS